MTRWVLGLIVIASLTAAQEVNDFFYYKNMNEIR